MVRRSAGSKGPHLDGGRAVDLVVRAIATVGNYGDRLSAAALEMRGARIESCSRSSVQASSLGDLSVCLLPCRLPDGRQVSPPLT